MTARRFGNLLAALALVGILLPQAASAIPVFARKYGVNCTMCHSSYPRLNDLGVRFRNNGYRMPGLADVEKTVLDSPVPVALRTSAGYNYELTRNSLETPAPDKRNTLELNGLDLLAAGLLGRKIGFFMVYTPTIAEQRGIAGQEASLEMANLVFSELFGSTFGLRVGRFEPAYAAFSVKRQLSVSPYDIYSYSFEGGPTFSDTQTGLEVAGRIAGPVRIVAGLVEGSATNTSKDLPQDGYARVECVLGAGEGQTAGQRLGITGYFGQARPAAAIDTTSDCLDSFSRIGLDASLNFSVLNLSAQYLWASDSRGLWFGPDSVVVASDDRIDWSGGFAELTYTSDFRLAGFARYDLVQQPSFIEHDISRMTLGCRYHFEDNVAAHLELSRQVTSADVGDDQTRDSATARLDFAF